MCMNTMNTLLYTNLLACKHNEQTPWKIDEIDSSESQYDVEKSFVDRMKEWN